MPMPYKPRTRQRPRQRARDDRPNSSERGYDYQWQQFRLRYLAEHPLCADCENPDPLMQRWAFGSHGSKVRPAVHIHHKRKLADHPELKYDDDNLLPLCADCHNRRTARGE